VVGSLVGDGSNRNRITKEIIRVMSSMKKIAGIRIVLVEEKEIRKCPVYSL
jgi:hypothetical protein